VRGKITKRAVDALRAGDILADEEVRGFVVRCLPSRVVTYGLRYRAAGKQRWLALGLHGKLTPEQARDLAKQRAGEVAGGRDPAAEIKAKTMAAAKLVAVGSVVPKYLHDRQPVFRAATYSEQARYLERYWQPLHQLAFADVQRSLVVATIDTIAEKHGRVAADRARTALSAFFTWAIDRSYCDLNPVQNIQRRSQSGPRSRVLSEPELVAVWKACLDDDHGWIIRLLILTGQRKSEIGDLGWCEIDLEKRQIELPPERTKNGRAHIVPLSNEALAVLSNAERLKGRSLVFGKGGGGFVCWSRAKRNLDNRLPTKMLGWTVHDIRRSVVTHLHELGFAHPHVVEAIVNHVSGHQAGVAGVYNKAAYLSERRRALDLWGQHIATLVDGKLNSAWLA
jgi:integrase